MKIDLSNPHGPLEWKDIEVNLSSEIDREAVRLAVEFSKKCHLGQKRLSGEDFVVHPIWIAKVVAQLGLGQAAIITALLHDTVEDSETTIEQIAANFGDEVALLVDGLTEISNRTKGVEIHKVNIEIFRNFLFSSVNDVRILIIRLVDKLHNGLTIESLPKDKQIRYAKRVLSIYGPVAEYVGLHFFKQQLEDIAFKILYSKEAKLLEDRILKISNQEARAQELIINDIRSLLVLNHINNYEIQTRIKSLYSTYNKVVKKLGSFDNFNDFKFKDRVGIRILLDKLEDCYLVLGLLHSRFKYQPEEFDDYISNPKLSGYRSIQTTIHWNDKVHAEIQIRTYEMHEFNEFGPASHIAYKMSKNLTQSRGMEWVKDLIKWQRNDKVSNYQISVLTDNIYVFTPKGDVIQLPKGSSALDFAYTLHSHLGDFCKGVLVNNKMVKISDPLKTGDLVEILVDYKMRAKPEWLNYVVSAGAKEHLRKLRNKERDL